MHVNVSLHAIVKHCFKRTVYNEISLFSTLFFKNVLFKIAAFHMFNYPSNNILGRLSMDHMERFVK